MADDTPVVIQMDGGGSGLDALPDISNAFLDVPLEIGPPPAPDITLPTPEVTPPLDVFSLTALGALGAAVLGAVIPGSAPLSQQHPPSPEPQPSPALPPSGPTGAQTVAASPEIPFNWWDLGQGGNPDVFANLTGPSPIAIGSLGEFLDRLLRPGNLGDVNVDPTPPAPDVAGLLQPFEPTPIARAPTETVFVTGSVPIGDPLVVPDPVLSPVYVHPGDVPSLPPPAIAPFEPFVQPDVGTGPQFSVGFGQPGFGIAFNPLGALDPGVLGGLVPATRVGVVPTGGLVRPIGDIGSGVGIIPIVPISPIVPIVPINPIVPIDPILSVGPSTDVFPETQAQMLTAANQCTQTRQKQRQQKRKPRTKCHSGTYTEFAKGTSKHPQRVIPCR